jgi:hypothetical protein
MTAAADVATGGHSGRRFVLVAGCILLVIWGTLWVIFRDWRVRYRARAAYGATHVVPAIDPLESIVPAGVEPEAWRDAVRQTRAMLITVTCSNLLDMHELDDLRRELDGFVARVRAHPETGCLELAAIWDEMADRAEFLFKDSRSASGDRHPRPKFLPRRPEKGPRQFVPHGPVRWLPPARPGQNSSSTGNARFTPGIDLRAGGPAGHPWSGDRWRGATHPTAAAVRVPA